MTEAQDKAHRNQRKPTPELPNPREEALRRLQHAQEEILEARACLHAIAKEDRVPEGEYIDLNDFISIALSYVGEASYRLRGDSKKNRNGREIKWVEGKGLISPAKSVPLNSPSIQAFSQPGAIDQNARA